MDKWLKNIRDRLKDYEQNPPEDLWQSLQGKLGTDGDNASHRHAVHIGVWPRRLAMAACVAAVVIVACLFVPDFSNDDAPLQVAEKHADMVSADSEAISNMPAANWQTEPSLTLALAGRAGHATNVRDAAIVSVAKAGHEEAETPAVASVQSVEQNMPVVGGGLEEEQKSVHAAKPLKASAMVKSHSQAGGSTPSESKGEGLSLSAYTTGSTGSYLSMQNAAQTVGEVLGSDNSGWEDDPALGMAVYNQGMKQKRTIHHRLPVKVGVSFAYAFTDKWALGSGVSYAYLHSDLRYGSGEHYSKGEQKLHYVGVPVNVKYTVWSHRGLSLYAQAGLMAEVRVAGKMTEEYVLEGKSKGVDTERIHSHPVQMSANLMAGVQYNLTPSVSLYAEPGVSCYFDDGSHVQTIYKEKPVNFNLNAGLRFCLGR